jgi:mRNA-degrading endonuclease RelE of RelBE toxin-antitoxin system
MVKVLVTSTFQRRYLRLAKKYRSMAKDVTELQRHLQAMPRHGTPLGKNCYKIRLAVKSKGKGKRGGVRVVTHVLVRVSAQTKTLSKTPEHLTDETIVYLLAIYDKSELSTVREADLEHLLANLPVP